MGDAVWAEIERCESFLVCSMYEEAATLASSVIKKRGRPTNLLSIDFELYEAMEAAGMVMVQSLKQLSRTSMIMNELKTLFVSIEAIPVQVLLTGVCFQISEASTLGAREFLEEFLNKWRYVDEQYYVLASAEINLNFKEGSGSHLVLGIDQYAEVVELYAVMLLGTVSRDVDLAISWVEQAALPDKKRQELLRRLQSLYSTKEPNVPEGTPKGSKTGCLLNGENDSKQAILKLYRKPYGCLWWFRNITLKFSNYELVISSGKILIGCLILFIYYVFRRKKVSLRRIITRQALFVKKSLVDFWQLAFSYQVNPLAAIQSLPAAT
ncbi:hypothetical protein REPUB_Repub03eG0148500 [Reevesia pubescens]